VKTWFIIALVIVVAVGVAIYSSVSPDNTLFQTFIQPRITPELAIDVDHVGASNWIYLTASKSSADLSGLGDDVSFKVLRGNAGRVYRARDYGPAGGLTYSFQGAGGTYRLEVSFAHPDKWPEELSLKITPSP